MKTWKTIVWIIGIVLISHPLFAFDLSKLSLTKGIKEYQLDNGLKVIIKEERSIPLVGFSVTYRVGFRDENVNGKTGMTHLLEHMMFKGTTNLSKGQVSKVLSDVGARFNAFTSYDKTCYWEVLPVSGLETAMQVEADRMVNSLFDKTEFDLEKNVVLSELKLYENDPNLQLWREYYTQTLGNHPLSFIYGTISDMEKADRDFVYREIYQKYYVPNNAYIVIVGDIDAQKALSLVKKHFGKLKPNPDLPESAIIPYRQTNGVNVVVEGVASEDFGSVVFNLPRMDINDPDCLALLFVSWTGMLGGFYYDARIDGGMGEISYSEEPTYPAETLDNDYIINNFETFKDTLFGSESMDYDTVYSSMMTLIWVERLGNYRDYDTVMRYFKKLKPAEVIRVIKKYLNRENANTAFFKAKYKDFNKTAKSIGQTSENFSAGIDFSELENPTAKDLQKAKDFNARLSTDMKETVNKYLSDVKMVRLDNGLTLIHKPFSMNQKVSIYTGVKAGSLYQKKSKQADFATDFIFLAGPHSILRNELINRGAQINYGNHVDFSSLSINLSVSDFAKGVEIVGLALKNRRFAPLLLEEQKHNSLNGISKIASDPSVDFHADRLLRKMILGRKGAGLDYFADYPDLMALSMQDIEDYYVSLVRPENTVIVVVGNIDFDLTLSQIKNNLGDWKQKKAVFQAEEPKIETPNANITETVTLPSMQSVVLLAAPSVTYNDSLNYIATSLATSIFGGGGLTSRLMRIIRDKHGLTYGVFSYLQPIGNQVAWTLYMQNAKKDIDKALSLFREALAEFKKNGPTEMEIYKYKNDFLYSVLFSYENGPKIANRLLYLKMRRNAHDYDKELVAILDKIDRVKLNEVIAKYFPERFFTAIAGE